MTAAASGIASNYKDNYIQDIDKISCEYRKDNDYTLAEDNDFRVIRPSRLIVFWLQIIISGLRTMLRW